MFSLSTSTPCEIAGTIRVKHPIRSLGNITDIDGVVWNIHSCRDNFRYVCAARLGEMHPSFNDTSGQNYYDYGTARSNFISQTWLPYTVEVVTE